MQCKPLLKAGITSKLDQIVQASFNQNLKILKDWRVYSFPGQPVLQRCAFLMKNSWVFMSTFILKHASIAASEISEITAMMSYHHPEFK